MPSKAETFLSQCSASQHFIAFTVNVSIKRHEVARFEGNPQCMLRPVLETRYADDIRLTELLSDWWRCPAAESDVLPSNAT